MTDKPAVSIITPFKNAEDFLPGLLKCVAEQRLDDHELILVDDGSTDASCVIVDAAKRFNPRIIHLQTDGVGVASARNLAIAEASADHLAFLDVDDRWHTAQLPSQMQFMIEHPEVVFSFANYAHVTEQGPIAEPALDFWPLFRGLGIPRNGFHKLPKALSKIFAENAVGTSTVVARRDAVLAAGTFDLELRSATDLDLWLRLAQMGDVALSREVRMDYLMRPGSISSNQADRLAAIEIIFKRYGDIAEAEQQGSLRRAHGNLQQAIGDLAVAEERFLPAAFHHMRATVATGNTRSAKSFAHDLYAALAF